MAHKSQKVLFQATLQMWMQTADALRPTRKGGSEKKIGSVVLVQSQQVEPWTMKSIVSSSSH